MGTARRLYVYFASLVSLTVLAVGASNLLTVLFDRIVEGGGLTVISGGTEFDRNQISLAIALVVVGLPIWLVHWWIAERGARGPGPSADDERTSTTRAFHFTLIQAFTLGFAIVTAFDLLAQVFRVLLGVDDGRSWANSAATLMTVVPIWLYHGSLRLGDSRRSHLREGAVTLSRLYRYGATLGGMVVGLVAATAFVATLLEALIGGATFGSGDTWLRQPLAGAVAGMLVGFGAWWVSWLEVRGAIRNAPMIGTDDRVTRLRAAYFGIILLGALGYVASTAAAALAEAGRGLLSSADWSGVDGLLRQVVGPVLAAVPVLVAAWLHRSYRRREVLEVGSSATISDTRVSRHLTAIVGLAFLGAGITQLLGAIIDAIAGHDVVSGSDPDFAAHQVPWFISQIVVGLVVWWPAWAALLRQRAVDPETHRQAGSTRAYLYLVTGGSLLAAVPSAVFVLYRSIDGALGGGMASGTGISMPIAILVVGAIGAVYHGQLARSSHRSVAPIKSPDVAQAGLTAMATRVSLGLTLRGPADSDLDAVAAALRAHLPAGVTLEPEPPREG